MFLNYLFASVSCASEHISSPFMNIPLKFDLLPSHFLYFPPYISLLPSSSSFFYFFTFCLLSLLSSSFFLLFPSSFPSSPLFSVWRKEVFLGNLGTEWKCYTMNRAFPWVSHSTERIHWSIIIKSVTTCNCGFCLCLFLVIILKAVSPQQRKQGGLIGETYIYW